MAEKEINNSALVSPLMLLLQSEHQLDERSAAPPPLPLPADILLASACDDCLLPAKGSPAAVLSALAAAAACCAASCCAPTSTSLQLRGSCAGMHPD